MYKVIGADGRQYGPVTAEQLQDFADMAGIELLTIGADTGVGDFRKELRWNQVYYHLAGAL